MNNGTTIRELSSVGSERLPYKQRVGGSNPSAPTLLFSHTPIFIGRLAQLVQSVCLTSRGSGVRLPQLPPEDLFKKLEEVFCCVAGVTLTKLVQVQPQVFRIKSKTLC